MATERPGMLENLLQGSRRPQHDVTLRNRRGADSRGGQALTGVNRTPTDGGRSAVAAGETAANFEKEVAS